MNDSFSKSFLDSLQVKPRGPQISKEDYARLREAYDANKAAASSAKGAAVGKVAEDALVRLPLGVIAHLMDAAKLPFQLIFDPEGLSRELNGTQGGTYTDAVVQSASDPEASPSLNLLLKNNEELKQTGSGAKAYEEERRNRASAKQLETANMLDPMNFLKNLRGR